VIFTQVGPRRAFTSTFAPLACSWAASERAKVERGRERNVLLLLLLFASFVPFLSPDIGAVPFTLPNCRDRGCRWR